MLCDCAGKNLSAQAALIVSTVLKALTVASGLLSGFSIGVSMFSKDRFVETRKEQHAVQSIYVTVNVEADFSRIRTRISKVKFLEIRTYLGSQRRKS